MNRSQAALLLIAAAPMLGQGSAGPSAAADPLAPIAWMAGGVWHGEANGPGGKPTRIDTRIERELGGKAFSFSTSFDGVQQYQGFFAYDAAKKTIVFSYPSSDGSLAEGTVVPSGDALLWDFHMTEASGSVEHYQVHVHQDGADDYTWALFAQQNNAWAKLFEIHYHRSGA
jgi:hypothetical protein